MEAIHTTVPFSERDSKTTETGLNCNIYEANRELSIVKLVEASNSNKLMFSKTRCFFYSC
jgi:hypothetical protein